MGCVLLFLESVDGLGLSNREALALLLIFACLLFSIFALLICVWVSVRAYHAGQREEDLHNDQENSLRCAGSSQPPSLPGMTSFTDWTRLEVYIRWTTAVMISLGMLQLSMWSILSFWYGWIFTWIPVAIASLWGMRLTTPQLAKAGVPESDKILRLIRLRRGEITRVQGIAALLCFVLTAVLADGCLCFFNPDEGGFVYIHPISFSSRISRALQGHSCPSGPPCHVYFTFPENAESSIIVNAHTHPSVSSIDVTVNGRSYVPQRFELRKGIETNGQRNIFSVLIRNIEGDNATIRIVTKNEEDCTYYVRTNVYNDNFRFLSGGDMGSTESVRHLSRVMASFSPSFAVVGGDISYDNGFPTCYRSWDAWLTAWETNMVTEDGFSIPVILAVGNHDIGINALSGNYLINNQTPVPFLLAFFPQETTKDGMIPGFNDRIGYHSHQFGTSIALFVLDSGYISPHGGEQSNWMIEILEQNRHSTKANLAVYHEPIFPYSAHWNDPNPVEKAGREAWEPIFNKYNFPVVFENHMHAFKRTAPLRNGKISDDGTIYVGDGFWGIIDPITPTRQRRADQALENEPGLIKSGAYGHVWLADVSKSKETITCRAYNGSKVLLDQFTVPFLN